MASAEITLLTTAAMATPTLAITVTDEATGYPKAYMINNDLDRYFKFNTFAGNMDVNLDFGSGVTVNGEYGFLWLRNYAALTGSPDCSVYSSTNGSTYTFRGNFTISGATRPALISTYLGVTTRYWRFRFSGLAAAPEIAMLALCPKRNVIHPGDLPQADIPLFRNRSVMTEGGRDLVTAINSRKQRVIDRRYTLESKTDRDTFHTAYEESGGNLRPLIVQENVTQGAGDGEPIVCRFEEGSFTESQTAFEFYELGFRLIELPSIPSGSVL